MPNERTGTGDRITCRDHSGSSIAGVPAPDIAAATGASSRRNADAVSSDCRVQATRSSVGPSVRLPRSDSVAETDRPPAHPAARRGATPASAGYAAAMAISCVTKNGSWRGRESPMTGGRRRVAMIGTSAVPADLVAISPSRTASALTDIRPFLRLSSLIQSVRVSFRDIASALAIGLAKAMPASLRCRNARFGRKCRFFELFMNFA